ncbi:MAG: hypothetical protein JO147_01080 [Actinobacteria bacterium]|nr:hypothetical protein [Actinomycetota bacterium]
MDLGFLVDREHHGAAGRLEIESDGSTIIVWGVWSDGSKGCNTLDDHYEADDCRDGGGRLDASICVKGFLAGFGAGQLIWGPAAIEVVRVR